MTNPVHKFQCRNVTCKALNYSRWTGKDSIYFDPRTKEPYTKEICEDDLRCFVDGCGYKLEKINEGD